MHSTLVKWATHFTKVIGSIPEVEQKAHKYTFIARSSLCTVGLGENLNQIANNLLSQMFFNVKFNFKEGLFSSIFLFEGSLLCKISLFALVTLTF